MSQHYENLARSSDSVPQAQETRQSSEAASRIIMRLKVHLIRHRYAPLSCALQGVFSDLSWSTSPDLDSVRHHAHMRIRSSHSLGCWSHPRLCVDAEVEVWWCRKSYIAGLVKTVRRTRVIARTAIPDDIRRTRGPHMSRLRCTLRRRNTVHCHHRCIALVLTARGRR